MNSIIIILSLISALISYQPVESGLKFDHKAHVVERDMQCVDCHNVSESKLSSDTNLPGHDECSDCHSLDDAPDDCALCHLNPDDPIGIESSARELIFSHAAHIKAQTSADCLSCHTGVNQTSGKLGANNYPVMDKCFECHDGVTANSECDVCHSRPAEMSALVHPPDWKHEHKYSANAGQNCGSCHHAESFCADCHAGDNLVENVHDLNYRYTHGIDAKNKNHDCQSCHDIDTFCSTCHQDDSKPLNHTLAGWQTAPYFHAEEARNDIESCAACHSGDLTICARCHREGGTAGSIHIDSMDDYGEGPWHDDPGYYCFDCHTNTNSAGVGFCGNCHGAEVD